MSNQKRGFNEGSSWSTEDRKYILAHAKEMSLEEMSSELLVDVVRLKGFCVKSGISYFTECSRSWKKKGYKEGTSGYAMYPYKGSFRESASVSNAMLRGEE